MSAMHDKIPEIIKKAEHFYKKIDNAKNIREANKLVEELWAHYEKEAEKLGLYITDFVEPHMDYQRERKTKK